jgi:hypothetical protein
MVLLRGRSGGSSVSICICVHQTYLLEGDLYEVWDRPLFKGKRDRPNPFLSFLSIQKIGEYLAHRIL